MLLENAYFSFMFCGFLWHFRIYVYFCLVTDKYNYVDGKNLETRQKCMCDIRYDSFVVDPIPSTMTPIDGIYCSCYNKRLCVGNYLYAIVTMHIICFLLHCFALIEVHTQPFVRMTTLPTRAFLNKDNSRNISISNYIYWFCVRCMYSHA